MCGVTDSLLEYPCPDVEMVVLHGISSKLGGTDSVAGDYM
jgi:hypothetical protein